MSLKEVRSAAPSPSITNLIKGEEMGEQLTTPETCKRKHTYWSAETARQAKRRRNKAAGINYLRSYKCNLGDHWHVTTEVKVT